MRGRCQVMPGVTLHFRVTDKTCVRVACLFRECGYKRPRRSCSNGELQMAKKSKRRAWSATDVRSLKTMARNKKHAGTICTNAEKNRRCYPSKGIQHGIIAGQPRLSANRTSS